MLSDSPSEKPREKDKKKAKNDRHKRSRSRSREKQKRSRSRDRHRRGERKTKSKSRSRSRSNNRVRRKHLDSDGVIDPARKEKADLLAKRVVANPIPAPERRVYVGGLAYDLSEEHIKQPFSAFGPIVMVDMPRDAHTNRSKGFCFVEYTTREAAEHALMAMNGYTIGGRAIKVGRSNPVGGMSSLGMPSAGLMALRVQQIRDQAMTAMRVADRQESARVEEVQKVVKKAKPDPAVLAQAKAALARKIYVGQIPETLSSEHVRAVFDPFGKIVSLRLSTAGAAEGLHKGYGFIEFDTEEAADKAAELMNGFDLCGKTLKVTKAIA